MELFYYTSTDTMKYILKQEDIFATNIRYMNDSEEYINGLKELYQLSQKNNLLESWIEQQGLDKSLLNKIQNTFSESNLKENMQKMEYYSISFCKKNDLLSQWAIYAKESGVSIKMNFQENSYKFLTTSTIDKESAVWNLLPQEVYYFTYGSMSDKEDIYQNTAYKILDQLYTETSKDKAEWKKERWRYISTLVKRYDFYQEEEYRLVFEPTESVFPPNIEYRLDKKVLKPYLDIKCEDGWPIWEIMIGPGFNQQVVYDSVEHFLNHAKVCVGIRSTEDYIKRIKKYFKPFHEKLKKYKEYSELFDQLTDKDWIDSVKLEDAQIYFVQKLYEINKVVCEDPMCDEEVKHYFAEHHFTESGVVLTKSSIPYIF